MTERSAVSKRALLLGVGPGMGLATARRLAQEGFQVVVGCRTGEKAEAYAQALREEGRDASGLSVDVRVPASVALALQQTGSDGLDLLYLGAGGYFVAPEPWPDLTLEWYQEALANLTAAAFTAVPQAVEALARRGGSVVMVGAAAATKMHSNPAYAAGKAALDGLALYWAKELAPRGIRVNAVLPGLIRLRGDQLDPPSGLNRKGHPADVADAVSFLAGAPWVTGSLLTVDGGWSLGVDN